MKQSRLRFKSALRYCKVNEDAMRSNAFAKSLMDIDMNSFWRGIRKVNNAKIPLASTVENCVDELSICDIDGHESKPAISILAIVQESRKTSAFRYFSSYSFYFIR